MTLASWSQLQTIILEYTHIQPPNRAIATCFAEAFFELVFFVGVTVFLAAATFLLVAILLEGAVTVFFVAADFLVTGVDFLTSGFLVTATFLAGELRVFLIVADVALVRAVLGDVLLTGTAFTGRGLALVGAGFLMTGLAFYRNSCRRRSKC